MTANEHVSLAITELKQANDAINDARTNLVLAGLGKHSILFQKQLEKISNQLVIIKRKAVKQVGAIR